MSTQPSTFGQEQPPVCSNTAVASELPFCLPDGYNRFVRPFRGRDVLNVSLAIWITDIISVNDLENTLSLDFFVDMYWTDPRLTLNSEVVDWANKSEVAVGLDLIKFLWLPDLEIGNLKEFHQNNIVGKVGSFELSMEKEICYSFPARVVLECPFSFNAYPLDEQHCDLSFGSYVFTKEELVFTGEVTYFEKAQRALEYQIEAVWLLSPEESLLREYDQKGNLLREFANVGVRIKMERQFMPHLLRGYLASGVVVMTSFISFIIEPNIVPGRMALLVTLLLVLVNMSTGILNILPNAEGLTAIEVWNLVCLGFVLFALLEYAVILYLIRDQLHLGKVDNSSSKKEPKMYPKNASLFEEKKKSPDLKTIDLVALIVFPTLFMLYNFCYWVYYLKQ